MPPEPWITPLLAAFLAGLLAGFSVTLAVLAGRHRILGERRERLTFHARWLAAHLTLSRSSISLVAALRALRQDSGDSSNQALRVSEAKRARRDWFTARRDFDRAATALESWYVMHGASAPCDHVLDRDPSGLRIALDGDDAALGVLVAELKQADTDARERVRCALQPTSLVNWAKWENTMRRVFAPFRGVWQRWDERT